MKKIMVELWFEDDFVPADYFEEPCWANNWASPCQNCPLFSWSDDPAHGECHFCGEWEEKDGKSICPIKKYFVEETHFDAENAPTVDEKTKGCQYCLGEFAEYQHTYNTKVAISTFGRARTLETECMPCPPYANCSANGRSFRSAFIINYCPNCGRKLGE